MKRAIIEESWHKMYTLNAMVLKKELLELNKSLWKIEEKILSKIVKASNVNKLKALVSMLHTRCNYLWVSIFFFFVKRRVNLEISVWRLKSMWISITDSKTQIMYDGESDACVVFSCHRTRRKVLINNFLTNFLCGLFLIL